MKSLTYDIHVNRTAKLFDGSHDWALWAKTVGILQSPVLAFRFALVWERVKREGGEPFEISRSFADSLHSLIQPTGDDHPLTQAKDGSSVEALDSYMEVTSRLLKQWRACDQDPVQWWITTDNQEDVHLVQRAVASTIFSLRLERRIGDMQPTPPWGWGESDLPKGKYQREIDAAFDAWQKAMVGDTTPMRVVKTMPLLREKLSLIEAARTMAYLLFSEVLVHGLKVQFCSRCEAAFLPGKKEKYCSPQCGHVASGLETKSKKTRRINWDRVQVASKAIAGSRRDWRPRVESALVKKSLIVGGKRKSQWLGRCIRAAAGSEDSPQRARLAELCTRPGASEEETEQVSKGLIAFYALIRQAQCRENGK